MPYYFLEDIAIADVAFKAWGQSLEEMFVSASEATMNVMVKDLSTITPKETRIINLTDETVEMLLFQLLQELIFLKDAEQLLLRVHGITISQHHQQWRLNAQVKGEILNPHKHELIVDVKAVTLHKYNVEQKEAGWETNIILDI